MTSYADSGGQTCDFMLLELTARYAFSTIFGVKSLKIRNTYMRFRAYWTEYVYSTVTICNGRYTAMISFANLRGQTCHRVRPDDDGPCVIFSIFNEFLLKISSNDFRFFPYVIVRPTICRREIFGENISSSFPVIWGPSALQSKNSNRHNSGPEVYIDKRSTAFFTVRRPLGDAIKSFRQGPHSGCTSEMWCTRLAENTG